MKFQHGIVTDEGICFVHVANRCAEWVSYPIREAINHAGNLVELGLKYGLTGLWVLPGSTLSHRIRDLDQAFIDQSLPGYDIFPYRDTKTGETILSTSFRGYPLNDHYHRAETVQINLPEYDGDWLLANINDAKALHATISYLQALLGIEIAWSTHNVGRTLLKKTCDTPHTKTYLRVSESDLAPFETHTTHSPSWSRELSADEQDMLYLHVVDRNGDYLITCSDVSLGIGEYTYQVNPTFNKRLDGVWHIKLTGTSQFDGVSLPHPTEGKTDAWVYTPTIEICQLVGYQVELLEAYVFTDSKPIMKQWCEVLKAARQALLEDTTRFRNEVARQAALTAVKRIYTSTVGYFSHIPEYSDNKSWSYRPDYDHMVIDKAAYRTYLNLVKHPGNLVGIDVDALYYISNTPDLIEALPHLTINSSLGKYKPKGIDRGYGKGTYKLSDIKHLLNGNITTLRQGLAQVDKEYSHNG